MFVKFIKNYWIILTLCLVAIVLRLVNLEQLFYFTYDEEVPAFVGRRFAIFGHIPLIGGVTPFGFHLPPYFYWLLGVLLWMGDLNPIIWGVAGALLSVLTIFLIFLVGQELKSKAVGIIAATIWSFSYLANVYDRHFWALYWGPMLSLVVLFSLIKIIKSGSIKCIYLLSIGIIWSIATDPSNISLVILSAIVWLYYKIPLNKHFFIGIVLVVASLLPLVFFDLKHDFANTRPVLSFFENKNQSYAPSVSNLFEGLKLYPTSLVRMIFSFGDNNIAKEYSYCGQYIQERNNAIPQTLILITGAILVIFLVWSIRNNKKNLWRIVAIQLFIYLIGLGIYGVLLNGPLFEHYISGLFPVFVLLIALGISRLNRPFILVVLGLFIFLNLYKIATAQNNIGFLYKMNAIRFSGEVLKDQEFGIESVSNCWRYSGYRYLFTMVGGQPVKSYVDSSLGYLYEDLPKISTNPKRIVIFMTHSQYERNTFYEQLELFTKHSTHKRRFGDVEVIIVDNTDDWYGKL